LLKLYIGNKNYSSWSMRPWVVLRQAGIPFEEVKLRFDSFGAQSDFKRSLRSLNPVGKVPVLDDDGFAVWDTLAIAEYLHEKFPSLGVWPAGPSDRARARSLCAEMHSGFGALRQHCPMNIEADLSDVGRKLWTEQPDIRTDLERIDRMWGDQLSAHGGPMLLGEFSAVDAFYAPVCSRIRTYGLPVSEGSKQYVQRIEGLASVQAWNRAALGEHHFVDFDEPYRQAADTPAAPKPA
jgi:glutathione S-transferase